MLDHARPSFAAICPLIQRGQSQSKSLLLPIAFEANPFAILQGWNFDSFDRLIHFSIGV